MSARNETWWASSKQPSHHHFTSVEAKRPVRWRIWTWRRRRSATCKCTGRRARCWPSGQSVRSRWPSLLWLRRRSACLVLCRSVGVRQSRSVSMFCYCCTALLLTFDHCTVGGGTPSAPQSSVTLRPVSTMTSLERLSSSCGSFEANW